jgi:hypothetical protein
LRSPASPMSRSNRPDPVRRHRGGFTDQHAREYLIRNIGRTTNLTTFAAWWWRR